MNEEQEQVSVKFALRIESGNDAFQEGFAEAELSRCLAAVTTEITYGKRQGVIRDGSGNRVGDWEWSQ